jgi:hypothetical protein
MLLSKMKRTGLILFSFLIYQFALPQTSLRDRNSIPESQTVLGPANGAGVMVAGELWDSFFPSNVGPYYGESAQPLNSHLLRIGNFDRAWSTPTHLWPGGWTNGNFWAKNMWLTEFNPDTTWNPPTIDSAANPAYRASSGSKYAFAAFKSTVAGSNDITRNYKIETRWVDPQKRHHAIYEAGWPTNIGVDVKIRVHQFVLNWNNFNDFIVVEVTLTNTGNLDMNANGIVERTGNIIRALTLLVSGEFMCSYTIGRSGGRGGNRFGATRAIGYVGDNDPKGSPWDIMVGFPGESAIGLKDMGLNDFPLRFYTDVWSGWSWLAVKRGSSSSDSLHLLPDKQSLYNTHLIGAGAQRGWYTSGGQGRGLNVREFSFDDPKSIHTAAMGVWYKDGGKTRSTSDAARLTANSGFFAGGTTGDPTSFIPKSNPARPNGDRKLFSEEGAGAFEVNTYEPAWAKGFSAPNNFDGDMYSGIGPFSLHVGESVTIVWAEAGGYRLRGIQNGIAAARWAFENGYTIPESPSVPDLKVINPSTTSARVFWDNRAESNSRFAGYKIYSASTGRLFNSVEGGMRRLDEYWRADVPFSKPDSLLQPVNPNFAAQSFVSRSFGVPDCWGPYDLVAVIPKSQLSRYADASENGYNYSYLDEKVILGFKYWYYVAAYTTESPLIDLGPAYAGLNSPLTPTIESANINRNGASGLWVDTYPFADLNAFYPRTSDGLKAIGAGMVVKSTQVDPKALASGAAKISVRPNPYKKKAFFDSPIDPFDHKIIFYNLPSHAKITILDVSGQIVKEIPFESNDPNNGSAFWDLFSKDGIEVASGLYIYHVAYEGGQHVGYFSILR